MARIAARSLLDAGRGTSVREDRITEVLACLIGQDPEARKAFCRLAEAPALEHADVLTQRSIPGVGRIDCEIRLTEGKALHVIWIEVKVGAQEQDQQLWRYAVALRHLYGIRSTLVALAPDGDEIFDSAAQPCVFDDGPPANRTAVGITWDRLGYELDQLGRGQDGRNWRTAAHSPDALARRRILCDVLDYLEREGIVESNDPIVSSDAHVIYRAWSLLDGKGGALKRILDLAIPRVELIAGREGSDRSDPSGGMYWRERIVAWDSDGWLAEMGPASAEIGLIRTDETERPQPRGEPFFFVGISFSGATPLMIGQLTNPSWDIGDDVWIKPGVKWARIQSGLYVSDLAVREVTLTTQAEALAEWANHAFEKLRTLPDPREIGCESDGGDSEADAAL